MPIETIATNRNWCRKIFDRLLPLANAGSIIEAQEKRIIETTTINPTHTSDDRFAHRMFPRKTGTGKDFIGIDCSGTVKSGFFMGGILPASYSK